MLKDVPAKYQMHCSNIVMHSIYQIILFDPSLIKLSPGIFIFARKNVFFRETFFKKKRLHFMF